MLNGTSHFLKLRRESIIITEILQYGIFEKIQIEVQLLVHADISVFISTSCLGYLPTKSLGVKSHRSSVSFSSVYF